MKTLDTLRHDVVGSERLLLAKRRTVQRERRATNPTESATAPSLTLGQRVADQVAATMGSWKFITSSR